ncbi:hypothetical protein FQN60_003216 [Etheostoma spectabile]|uniref:Uncharacterized protein n=1 Tax=Etheostoma spectabile TaxID=54343 RepID=A0A5J5CL77_9PERO|nr:hypothetical protein FQN60_003216 [Etheostoma spectabile]
MSNNALPRLMYNLLGFFLNKTVLVGKNVIKSIFMAQINNCTTIKMKIYGHSGNLQMYVEPTDLFFFYSKVSHRLTH